MPYSDFAASDAYTGKKSGAGVQVVILDGDDPAVSIIGAVSNINWSDDFEALPVEEAGNEGADEIVAGRHSGQLSISSFFTPERGDNVLSRGNFIGREFVVLEIVAPEREGAGNVLNAFYGCKGNRVSSSHGARGLKTLDLGFVYENRYNGQEYADLTGL